MLSDPDAMFGLADSASCSVSDMSVDGPEYVTQHLAEDDPGSAESDHDDTHDSHGGEDDHDDHPDSDDHDDHDSEQHEEVNASYEWECGNVSALESLALRFTEGFAGVETIEIQILTSAGAHVVTAEGRAASVSLSPR